MMEKVLAQKVNLLSQLKSHLLSDEAAWLQIKDTAFQKNAWFTPSEIDFACTQIAHIYLDEQNLKEWLSVYNFPVSSPQNIGFIMAGNIPLVGFHDWLCGYLSGHACQIKLSSKDDVLLPYFIKKIEEWGGQKINTKIVEKLENCAAYIATGSNNSARYFQEYFGKKPHIIRQNRTSVALLDGTETKEQLQLLGEDIFRYFGLGCRNVTQILVPETYDTTPLYPVLETYKNVLDHNKYKNNFEYQLAILLLNNVPHFCNEFFILQENNQPYSAVSVLHFSRYKNRDEQVAKLKSMSEIQCIVAQGEVPFGQSQKPGLRDYADGEDTMTFLQNL